MAPGIAMDCRVEPGNDKKGRSCPHTPATLSLSPSNLIRGSMPASEERYARNYPANAASGRLASPWIAGSSPAMTEGEKLPRAPTTPSLSPSDLIRGSMPANRRKIFAKLSSQCPIMAPGVAMDCRVGPGNDRRGEVAACANHSLTVTLGLDPRVHAGKRRKIFARLSSQCPIMAPGIAMDCRVGPGNDKKGRSCPHTPATPSLSPSDLIRGSMPATEERCSRNYPARAPIKSPGIAMDCRIKSGNDRRREVAPCASHSLTVTLGLDPRVHAGKPKKDIRETIQPVPHHGAWHRHGLPDQVRQ